MKEMNETFQRVTDETGKDYFCPVEERFETGPVGEPDTCVEASTVERYSGNLHVKN